MSVQEPKVESQEPVVEAQRPEHPRAFWPEGVELPEHHIKVQRRATPCPKCRRLLLPNGGQAAVCTGSSVAVAYFRCRSCGNTWSLPVKEV